MTVIERRGNYIKRIDLIGRIIFEPERMFRFKMNSIYEERKWNSSDMCL